MRFPLITHAAFFTVGQVPLLKDLAAVFSKGVSTRNARGIKSTGSQRKLSRSPSPSIPPVGSDSIVFFLVRPAWAHRARRAGDKTLDRRPRWIVHKCRETTEIGPAAGLRALSSAQCWAQASALFQARRRDRATELARNTEERAAMREAHRQSSLVATEASARAVSEAPVCVSRSRLSRIDRALPI